MNAALRGRRRPCGSGDFACISVFFLVRPEASRQCFDPIGPVLSGSLSV
jgi:hypothetical protein